MPLIQAMAEIVVQSAEWNITVTNSAVRYVMEGRALHIQVGTRIAHEEFTIAQVIMLGLHQFERDAIKMTVKYIFRGLQEKR